MSGLIQKMSMAGTLTMKCLKLFDQRAPAENASMAENFPLLTFRSSKKYFFESAWAPEWISGKELFKSSKAFQALLTAVTAAAAVVVVVVTMAMVYSDTVCCIEIVVYT